MAEADARSLAASRPTGVNIKAGRPVDQIGADSELQVAQSTRVGACFDDRIEVRPLRKGSSSGPTTSLCSRPSTIVHAPTRQATEMIQQTHANKVRRAAAHSQFPLQARRAARARPISRRHDGGGGESVYTPRTRLRDPSRTGQHARRAHTPDTHTMHATPACKSHAAALAKSVISLLPLAAVAEPRDRNQISRHHHANCAAFQNLRRAVNQRG